LTLEEAEQLYKQATDQNLRVIKMTLIRPFTWKQKGQRVHSGFGNSLVLEKKNVGLTIELTVEVFTHKIKKYIDKARQQKEKNGNTVD